jgi:hypothetical protein
MEISMEKVTQMLGELYLENRFSAERERQLTEQLKILEERVKNIEAENEES